MSTPKLTRLELQIMNALWDRGPSSAREIQESFPEKGRPAFTTVQTTIYRLESKGALRVLKRISNANIFEAAISKDMAHSRLVDDLLALFGGRPKPVMARLIETGSLTLDDIKEAEAALRDRGKRRKS